MLGRIIDENLALWAGRNGGATALLHRAAKAAEIHLGVRTSDSTYDVVLVPAGDDGLVSETSGQLVVAREFRHPRKLGQGHRESRLDQRMPGGLRYVSGAVRLLRGCRVYHFHDTSLNAPPKRTITAADDISIHADASNIAAALYRLQREDPTVYRRVVRTIQLVAPFFQDFVLEPNETGYIILRWRQIDQDVTFSANQLSDGTLRFVCRNWSGQ